MDNLGQPGNSALLSRQVSAARYFFLNLAPKARERLALVLGGRERCNPDYVVARRTFPFHVLEYVAAGAGRVRLDRRTHVLDPGSVFAYAPTTDCEIHTDPRQPMVKFFLAFSGPDVPLRLRRCGVAPGAVRRLAAPAEVTAVLDDLVREGQRAGALAPRICAALVELLLLKIEDGAAPAPPAGEPARAAFLRCKARVDADAERLATLADIAAAAGVEASSVCRWFRRFQGTSPYRYLLRRKMNLAAEHLVAHGGRVREVAARVGFADPLHFSRAFRAVHGVAPSALLGYRAPAAGGAERSAARAANARSARLR
jgi:AraC family transcriptional regulator